MRPKWHGKDWRGFTCGDCGYWIPKGCRKFQHFPQLQNGDDKACPDFEHRDVPDPDITDERTNLDHIKPEDRL